MKCSLLGHFFQEVVGLVHRAQVSADGDLDHVVRSRRLSGRLSACRWKPGRAELADERRGNQRR